MSNLIIPTAAAAAGFYLTGGSSTGTALGWAIGSAIQGGPDTDLGANGQIGDLRIQTSTYGQMIPFCVGKQRLVNNIIWAQDKKVVQTTERVGKGGFSGTETTVTTYTVSMAIAICVGPILGIRRVWADGTVVAEAGSGQTKLPGTLHLGTDVQTADPTIEAVKGIGNTPAYRGIAYMVLEDFDLGASGRVPNFSFEVMKEGGL